ncbi:MAG: hypothetical protein WC558_08385 [Patulibacter sp.]
MTEGRVPENRRGRWASTAAIAVAATLVAVPSADAAKTYKVAASGQVKLTKREPATKKIEQKGTISGAPFGRGTLTLRSKLAGRKLLEFSIRLVTPHGTVTGNGTATLKASGSQADYSGQLKITGGTRRYASITRSNLRVSGVGDSAARTTTVRITGSARY